jgi:TetR/AcrR family transcriptional regulator
MDDIRDHNYEQAILEAAEKLFLEKGFALTSTTEIAKAVGCNQALVHYYYRTKDKLFDAIFEKKVQLFVTNLLKIGDENIPFEEKLKRKIESHFDMIRANPKLPFLLINELTTNPKRLESIKEKFSGLPKAALAQMERELKSEIEKGTIRPIETIDLLLTILALNVTLFFASPIIKAIGEISDEDFDKLVERRKQENVHTIIKSLMP